VNRNVPWIFGALIVLFIVGVPYEYYRYRYTTLKRLRVVDEGKFYRSGCLTGDGFEKAIREYGIRTIINLQEEAVDPELPKSYLSMERERESELCKRLGVRYEFLLVDIIPHDQEATRRPPTVDAFFKIMDDPKAWPVLIHCKAGLHRTGVLVALYRMEYDGYSVYEALEEMRDNGFGRNPSYSPNDYIRQYLSNYVPRSKRDSDLKQVGRALFGAGINACGDFGLHDPATHEAASPAVARELSELSEQQKAFVGEWPPRVTGETDRIGPRWPKLTPADYEKNLEKKLTVDARSQPVRKVLDDLRVLLDLRFELDAETEIEQTLTFTAKEVSLLEILSRIAVQAKLECVVRNGVIRFRPQTSAESRNELLFNESEGHGQIRPHRIDEKMPMHLTPERVDGGIMP
jgi:tyrosine-protein phosphatase SIW14